MSALLAQGVERPLPASHFEALGEPGVRALIATFEDEEAPRHVRLRALSVLGALPQPSAHSYLLALAQQSQAGKTSPQTKARLGALHPARSTVTLRRLLEALARKASSENTLVAQEHLGHPDAQVRKQAVRLLAQDPSESATRVLYERVEKESSSAVRKELMGALKDRSAPRAAPPQSAPKSDSPPR